MSIALLTGSGVTSAEVPAVGIESMPRAMTTSGQNLNNGQLRFSHFTPTTSLTATSVVTETSSIAAGATPTLCRIGLWEVAENGDLTLVASTANNTALWSAPNTKYDTPLVLPVDIIAGRRYALGVLCVTAASAPQIVGWSAVYGNDLFLAPTLTSQVAGGGQTDLPASIPFASTAASFSRHYAVFLP